jgi:thiol-disulfide isomerase/thioredoxin
VTIRTTDGTVTLKESGNEAVIILFFDSGCPMCLDELRMLDRDIGRLPNARVYLLSDEQDLELRGFAGRWSNLAASKDVAFGIVSRGDAEARFGVLATPTLFVFGQSGALKAKMVGSRTVDAIVAAID